MDVYLRLYLYGKNYMIIKRIRKDRENHFTTDDRDALLEKITHINNRTSIILILNILLQIALLLWKWLKEG